MFTIFEVIYWNKNRIIIFLHIVQGKVGLLKLNNKNAKNKNATFMEEF